ncbi:MAG: DUF4892 domain-containing protein [Gammaproteobacteria bacterium]|nr:DUF4892 domain-containing protein [Gammaproteobacteria bacterium]
MASLFRLISKISFMVGCLSLSTFALADIHLEVAKNGRLVEQVQVGAPYYTLPISAMRKVNGVIGAEYSLDLSGQLTSYTWEMIAGISAETVHAKAMDSLHAHGAQVIFQCSGRTCGSSNQWANQVFHQSRLYGLDGSQAYAALKQETPDELVYYALYSTKRGNRKVYLHLEIIHGMKNHTGQ